MAAIGANAQQGANAQPFANERFHGSMSPSPARQVARELGDARAGRREGGPKPLTSPPAQVRAVGARHNGTTETFKPRKTPNSRLVVFHRHDIFHRVASTHLAASSNRFFLLVSLAPLPLRSPQGAASRTLPRRSHHATPRWHGPSPPRPSRPRPPPLPQLRSHPLADRWRTPMSM